MFQLEVYDKTARMGTGAIVKKNFRTKENAIKYFLLEIKKRGGKVAHNSTLPYYNFDLAKELVSNGVARWEWKETGTWAIAGDFVLN